MENLVRSKVRPIASGNARRSSRPREGRVGRKARSGVRVCIASST